MQRNGELTYPIGRLTPRHRGQKPAGIGNLSRSLRRLR
jgi:hypothetical protein